MNTLHIGGGPCHGLRRVRSAGLACSSNPGRTTIKYIRKARKMKAIVWTKYGSPDVLQLREVEKPAPRDNEVLVKIYATTVTTADCELRRFKVKLPVWFSLPLRIYVGLVRPKRITILGQELAGEIEAVGRKVTRLKKGDQVFSSSMFHLGAYAGYVCLPEAYPVLKPASMTYEEAATIPLGGINGLHFLRVAGVRSGQRVLDQWRRWKHRDVCRPDRQVVGGRSDGRG